MYLALLKKYRPLEPLNGVIVAMSLLDVVRLSPEQRAAQTQAIRRQLLELNTKLGVDLPVYLVFTKADLISGFREFFEDLDIEGRAQVFGATLGSSSTIISDGASWFELEFDLLVDNVQGHLLRRLQDERDLQRRGLIFSFTGQLSSLREPMTEIYQAIFDRTRYEQLLNCRGFYITSATQQGSPFDRLNAAIAQSYGLEVPTVSPRPNAGKSFFVTRLFQAVIFGEAGLIRRQSTRRVGGDTRRIAGLAAVAASFIALLIVWAIAFRSELMILADMRKAQESYVAAATPLDARLVQDDDLAKILPSLELAAELRDQSVRGLFLGGLGVSQWSRREALGEHAYQRALEALLLPRLLVHTERVLREAQNRDLYPALKAYLTLGGQLPIRPKSVELWLAREFERIFPGAANDQGRTRVQAHIRALLLRPLPSTAIDVVLVGRVQQLVGQTPEAARAYQLVVERAQDLAPWPLAKYAGTSGSPVFTRRSGLPLSEGIPGLFTKNGYHKRILAVLDDAVNEVLSDRWILTASSKAGPVTASERAAVKNAVIELYFQDYVARWETMLADLDISQFSTVAEGAEKLNILAGPASPIRTLLSAVAAETKLADTGALGAAESFVESRFSEIHRYVAAEQGAASPLDNSLRSLGELYKHFSRLSLSLGRDAPMTGLAKGDGVAVIEALNAAAAQAPDPVSRWLRSLAQGGSAAATKRAQADTARQYAEGVLPACRSATVKRYPFDPTGATDLSVVDFAKLIGPEGVLAEIYRDTYRSQCTESPEFLGGTADRPRGRGTKPV